MPKLDFSDDSSESEETKIQMEGDVVLGWESRSYTNQNVFAPRLAKKQEPRRDRFELKEKSVGNSSEEEESESEETEEEEEVEESESEENLKRNYYRPNLVIVQKVEKVEKEEKEEGEEKREEPKAQESLEVAQPQSVACSSTFTADRPEMRNRNQSHEITDNRFLKTFSEPIDVTPSQTVIGVQVVFYCSMVGRCSKAVWGWPYSAWPQFVFLRFHLEDFVGRRSFKAFCANHQSGGVHFGNEPAKPLSMKTSVHTLEVHHETKQQLFQYCADNINNTSYDYWEERFSIIPMVGSSLVKLWRTVSFPPKGVSFYETTNWITSYSLIYNAFCQIIFSQSEMPYPSRMNSLAEFFTFINETIKSGAQNQV